MNRRVKILWIRAEDLLYTFRMLATREVSRFETAIPHDAKVVTVEAAPLDSLYIYIESESFPVTVPGCPVEVLPIDFRMTVQAKTDEEGNEKP